MKKRSLTIAGHPTSITLENEFWQELKEIATRQNLSLNALVTEIDDTRTRSNLSSAIRLYILRDLQSRTQSRP